MTEASIEKNPDGTYTVNAAWIRQSTKAVTSLKQSLEQCRSELDKERK